MTFRHKTIQFPPTTSFFFIFFYVGSVSEESERGIWFESIAKVKGMTDELESFHWPSRPFLADSPSFLFFLFVGREMSNDQYNFKRRPNWTRYFFTADLRCISDARLGRWGNLF